MPRHCQPGSSSPAPVPPPPRRSSARRLRLLRWFIGLLVAAAVPTLAVTFGLVLRMLGQTELLARIIVGCVLVVVFGTPTLCLLGFFLGCFWLIAHAGRSRHPDQRAPSAHTSVPERVVVGEVMFDD